MNLALMLNSWWMDTLAAKPNRKGSSIEKNFPGITEDAKALGVTRPHLWMVLMGDRVSAKLTRRYKELKASQKGAGK